MKTTVFLLIMLAVISIMGTAEAWQYGQRQYQPRPYEDAWGNNYQYPQNLYKDTDKDGVPNYLDYNDRNPNIQNPYQQPYKQKKYRGY